MLSQIGRTLNRPKRRQSANFNATVGLRPHPAHRLDSAKIQNVLRLEQLLPHGRNQIRAASQYPNVARKFAKVADSSFGGTRPQQFELR